MPLENNSPITLQLWQIIRVTHVEEIFFSLPLGIPKESQEKGGLGIYGFFKIKDGREYLRYIGKSTDLSTRLRGPYYHEHWLPTDAVRVLPFPAFWQSRKVHKGCKTFPQYWSRTIGFLDLVEIRLIMKYSPPRNKHWVTRAPHEYCHRGRPMFAS
jgi:hypothetical protein